MKRLLCLPILLTGLLFHAFAQKNIIVQADKPIAPISPTMWGVFFEDINFAADGGLYAEMVKNRSFEFPAPLMGWRELKQKGTGRIQIINEVERAPNNRYVRLISSQGIYGLSNEGFRGMGIHSGKKYNISFVARSLNQAPVNIHFEFINHNGKTIGETSIPVNSKEWKEYKTAIQSTDTAQRGKMQVWIENAGGVDMDMISVFPHDTWKNRPNGLRADLVQMLADMKPGFVRFPGGCIVEGKELANRYQWKKTIGDPDKRELIMNRWNVEFRHKLTPDYYQSFGLGFYEYFLLAEDLGAEPLPILNCGMACQYNSAELVSMKDLDPYIQDALDLIEFANGDANTKWGKLRTELGHPAPFNLKILGVGNEQWDEQYIERYKEFEKVLIEKYPEVKLVSGSGPSPDGKWFDYAWAQLKTSKAAYVDEHYYKEPQWFLNNATRYDNYERKGPKIFAGEYAAHTKENPDAESRNNWESALAEAAFMTGLERNADIVHMASYAPLFAHVDAWQWRPDLIWFDNLRIVGTPNYYVQKLFASNKGTKLIPLTMNGTSLIGKDSIYGSAVIDEQKKQIIIKLVNLSHQRQTVNLNFGKSNVKGNIANVKVLLAGKREDYNTLDSPEKVTPFEYQTAVKSNKLSPELQASSLTVITVPCKKF